MSIESFACPICLIKGEKTLKGDVPYMVLSESKSTVFQGRVSNGNIVPDRVITNTIYICGTCSSKLYTQDNKSASTLDRK